jgi:hypothetical protein
MKYLGQFAYCSLQGSRVAFINCRLYKMALSAKLFGLHDAYESLVIYGRILIARGEDMHFKEHDLS